MKEVNHEEWEVTSISGAMPVAQCKASDAVSKILVSWQFPLRPYTKEKILRKK